MSEGLRFRVPAVGCIDFRGLVCEAGGMLRTFGVSSFKLQHPVWRALGLRVGG